MTTFHLFPSLLLLLSCWLIFGEGSQQLVITVSENGSDESCLRGNASIVHSCKTLVHVLMELSEGNLFRSHSVLVNVTYNQTINTNIEFDFSDTVTPLMVTVAGTKLPTITCKHDSYLAIGGGGSSRVNWVWEGLRFYGCFTVGDDYLLPGLFHDSLSSLIITHCKIMTTFVKVMETQNIVIDNTEFGQVSGTGYCSMITVLGSETIDETSTFSFSNNTFSNCQALLTPVSVLLEVVYQAQVIVVDNEFLRITFSSSVKLRAYKAIAIDIAEAMTNLTIQNNSFLENRLTDIISYNRYPANPISGYNEQHFFIQQNRFLNNIKSSETDPSHLVHINFVEKENTPWDITCVFLENQFISNYDMFAISIKSVGMPNLNVTMVKQIIKNNTAATIIGFIVIKGEQFVDISLSNVSAEGNTVNTDITVTPANAKFNVDVTETSSDIHSFIFYFYGGQTNFLTISDATFSNNLGTPIVLWTSVDLGTYLTLSGSLLFAHNTGLLGGAVSLLNHQVYVDPISTPVLTFIGNSAVYGGAVYLHIGRVTFKTCNIEFHFINNSAVTSGKSVYIARDPRDTVSNSGCNVNASNTIGVRTLATTISFIPPNNHSSYRSIFPGQNIIVNISITDYFGYPSSCTADAYFMCDSILLSCADKPIPKLTGPESVVLAQQSDKSIATIDTGFIILAPEGHVKNNISVFLRCRNANQTGVEIPLNITKCPLGFIYSQTESVCQCAEVVENSTFTCSPRFGAACVLHGHWYGAVNISDNTTTHTVAECSFPECSNSFEPCPHELLTADSTSEFVLLGFDADQQCSGGRGGVLCRNCAPKFEFTFTSTNCVSGNSCGWWQPYLILLISLACQIVIAVLLVFVVRFKLALGCGFLYGPMLFLAVVSHLPLDTYPEYLGLSTAISVITSIPLLNLELFGLVPWCFFPSFSKLYNYSLRYLGPLTVLTVILFLSLVARQCPNALRRWQSSPLKPVCILMLLSFWSLTDTSVSILTPTGISYRNGSSSLHMYVVSVQPDFKYFSPEHLPVAIPALLVLLVAITPLVSVLLLSPVLSRIINLYRIKPFLDEFHSCYQDRYRWYSAVYFIVWIAVIVIQEYLEIFYIQTIFIILMTVHFLIQPYRSRVLNITDILLLVDINFLIALLQPTSEKKSFTRQVAVHTLVVGPLLCIVVLVSCVCILKCGVYDYFHGLWGRRRQHPAADGQQPDEEQPQPPRVPVLEVRIFEESGEREPLIGIVNDQ